MEADVKNNELEQREIDELTKNKMCIRCGENMSEHPLYLCGVCQEEILWNEHNKIFRGELY